MSDENSEYLIEECETDEPQHYNRTLRLMKISASFVTSKEQAKNCYSFLNSNPISKSFPIFMVLIAIIQVFVFIEVSIMSGAMTNVCLHNSETYFDSFPWLFLPFTFLHDDFFHLMKTIIILTVFGIPQEIVFGRKVIGSLFLTGLITTTLIMQGFFPIFALCGASAGTFTIIFYQLYNWILNRKNMPYEKFQIRFIGVIMLYDVAKLFIYTYATGNISDHLVKYIIDRGNSLIVATLFGYIFVHHKKGEKIPLSGWILAFIYFLVLAIAFGLLAVYIEKSEVHNFN